MALEPTIPTGEEVGSEELLAMRRRLWVCSGLTAPPAESRGVAQLRRLEDYPSPRRRRSTDSTCPSVESWTRPSRR